MRNRRDASDPVSLQQQVLAVQVEQRTVELPHFQFTDKVVGQFHNRCLGRNLRHVKRSWKHRLSCTSTSMSKIHRF